MNYVLFFELSPNIRFMNGEHVTFIFVHPACGYPDITIAKIIELSKISY